MGTRWLLAAALTIAACTSADRSDATGNTEGGDADSALASEPVDGDAAAADTPTESEVEQTTTTSPPPAKLAVNGTVTSALDGQPLANVLISGGLEDDVVTSATDGSFTIEVSTGSPLTIKAVMSKPVVVDPIPSSGSVDIALEPVVVRGLRVSKLGAADSEHFNELLALADNSLVNTLVFDTKDEAGSVLYSTDVALATEINAVDAVYDPGELVAAAREHDLYTVTRIVTFEDPIRAAAEPETALGSQWMDAGERSTWQYPIDLAVEACELGFDEIQFDYVRFPDGRAAARAADRIPRSIDERTDVIATFLQTARDELHPMGCGVSAAIFGIVTASVTDEGIGQTVGSLAPSVDVLSPMLYPSHYGPGWIGFDDPNEHPGPVIAHALDSAANKVGDGTPMRPWIQGFYYNASQVTAQIAEAEKRGVGWIIWNHSGSYSERWLPASG